MTILVRPCKKCRRPIKLVRTKPTPTKPAGSWMPLDPDPSPRGNVALDSQLRAVVLAPGPNRAGEELYVPHFATCPVHKREQQQGRQMSLGEDP